VPLRDGVTLAADVWRAADADAPTPVLLQRTAYDKGELVVATHHAGLDPLRAVAAGFTVVIADVRGRFASAGAFSPFAQEAADGADAIAWVRDQPFCDGRVLTYGTSYNGALQLLADGADAVSVIECASPFHDGLTRVGGAVSLSFLAAWAANDLAPAELARRAAAGEDVDDLAADLAARRRDPRANAARLAAGDLGALDTLVPALRGWLDAAPRGTFPAAPADRPSLHVGGWHDLFLDATLAGFADGGAGARLVVGPWAHGVTGSRVGAVDHGPDAPQALTDVQLDFFSAVLEDRLGDVPRVRVFVIGENAWRTETAWPPARMREQRLAFAPGDGADVYAHDPRDPVPTLGGAIVCDPALGIPGPADRRALSARRDVLTYTFDPLPAPLELMGAVRAELHATTTAPETDWCVALNAVAPDGRALGIVDGVARTSDDRPVVALGATATVIPAGHRLQVQVASSNFPRVDAHPEPARQRVSHRSSIVLPITSGALS
jgi:putative CocE/NonD family hydrolase